MPDGENFEHLNLALRGRFKARFGRPPTNPDEVINNLNNRPAHAAKLQNSLAQLRNRAEAEAQRRIEGNLPAIQTGAGFLMHVPEGKDPDALARSLGVELVAEADGGFLLVATQDLSLQKLEEVLRKFAQHDSGGGAAACLLSIFDSPSDPHRLERLLTPEVLAKWPFEDDQEYIFDISIQTAEGTRSFKIPRVSLRADESEDDFLARRETVRMNALAAAEDEWADQAEQRLHDLGILVRFYGGTLLTDIVADGPIAGSSVIQFADSFQVRVRVNGKGWRDIISNLKNVFEVSLPDEVEQPLPPSGLVENETAPEILTPESSAPAVCVIDSGIQEGHVWLAPAIDSLSSACFLPGRGAHEVQDEYPNGGHGTRVAGVVLYPSGIPRGEPVRPVAFIQNARVLDERNQIPTDLSPAKYLEKVVSHFKASAKRTRIFNHSVAGNVPCPLRRMTAWATKIDELSHEQDILVIQASGNLEMRTAVENRPGVFEHLQAGREYPDYLEASASRLANPAQSLQALTVGSISADTWESQDKRSFGSFQNAPSAFSRAGLGIWRVIKPDVVEIGGDYARSVTGVLPPTIAEQTALELLRAAGDGGPAVARDNVGTSFAAPKIAHLAAHLQRLFPDSPTLLYRGLIAHSARWPAGAENTGWKVDRILKLMGYGLPSLARATQNAPHRATFVTADATMIRNQELHMYSVIIPAELRSLGRDVSVRIDVTLSYSSKPRRTRSSRRGYLATWLDWRSSGLREPAESFQKRMVKGEEVPDRKYGQFRWCLHYSTQHGDASETHRGNGTLQKDWASVPADELPEEFAIAVRAHKGWDHRDGFGGAKYCLIVSFEADDIHLPVYTRLSAANARIETEIELGTQINLELRA